MSQSTADAFTAFCTAGLWPGLRPAVAERLPEAGIAGPDDITADRLSQVPGVSSSRAERLVGDFLRARPAYDVVELLVAADLPPRLAAATVDMLGEAAASELRADPWRILGTGQIQPERADAFARGVLGREATPGDLRRGRALVAYLLARAARDGHTVQHAATVARAVAGFDIDDPAGAIEAALDEGTVLHFAGNGGEEHAAGDDFAAADDAGQSRETALLGLARYVLAEDSIAEGIVRLAVTSEPFCAPEDIEARMQDLDDAQRSAVQAVAEHGVSVLTGGPGTGKSRTVAEVVELAAAHGQRVALAAPTGRAAKRLDELTGATASTLHRLLGAQGRTGTFARGEDWPLDADLVVVDEASMLDVELAAVLVEACADGTHLLLVGDPAQLPSIGPGRVLADVIDAGMVPVTELRTLYRQDEGGAIAELAAAVRDRELPAIDSPEREVVVVPARGGGEAARRTVQLVTDSIPRALGIPADDVQVVTPVHRGSAGTTALNTALKAQLNPGGGDYRGFDIGDRVVAVANHTDEGFTNGEVGVVTGTADGGGLVVNFASGPVTVPAKLLGDLRHGWAVTVHRGQGSEWPAVVAVLPGEAAGMLSRPLVYTAFTRARRHLSVVHAAGPALARAVRSVDERPRRTRLADLLREGA